MHESTTWVENTIHNPKKVFHLQNTQMAFHHLENTLRSNMDFAKIDILKNIW